MPQIDTPLLLDILLGLVILLFVPFGIRRGVAKEAMVSAGIFLGATLAERFAGQWATELTARFSLERGAALFATSALLLFSGTFLLGYGAGAALGTVRPGTLSRLVGGLLAAFNAALLLSYLLTWIDRYLNQGSVVDDGVIGNALLRRTDLLLLAAAGVLLVLTVLGWIVGAIRSRRQPREVESGLAGVPPRQRPVRVSSSADGGKYEPGLEPGAPSGRFGQGVDATSPLAAGPALAAREPWREGEPTVQMSNGHSRGAYAGGRAPLGDAGAAGDETVWSAWSAQAAENPFAKPEPAGQWPVASTPGVTDDERCAICRARVGPRDVFCPECGATL